MISIKNRALIISSILIISVMVISFWNITKIFFQQDEWMGVGGAIYRQETFGTFGTIAQVVNFQNKNESTRFLPVTSISNHFIYNNLRLNFPAYGILAFIIITVSAMFLNLTIHKITNSFLLSTLTTLMWVTNNLAYQAFTWVGTMVPTLFVALFFILGLYFLLLYNEKGKKYLLAASAVSILISLFSKESSVFYVLTYLSVIWFFFNKSFGFLSKVKVSTLVSVPLIISIVLPRLMYLMNGQSNFAPPITPASNLDMIYNLFLLPAKSLFHIFLPPADTFQYVYSISRQIFGNPADGYVISRIVGDAFSLLVSFYILMLILLVVIQASKGYKKLIIFSLVSFFAALVPFIVFKNNDVIIEPRFYILPAIFSSLLAAVVINALVYRFKALAPALTTLIFIPILFFNISGVRKMLDQDIKVATYRREILETVSRSKPVLGNNNVFYFFTGHTGFYEFQSGFGQTLSVWFYDTDKIPKEALIDRDFWDMSYEGVKSFDKGKFGYFMTYDKLLKSMQENKDISVDSVHSFYWDYQKHTVEDVSIKIREKLTKDLISTKAL